MIDHPYPQVNAWGYVGFTDRMTAIDPTLRALSHPVRLRMMSLMWTEPQSAADLARELDISHALASQHLRTLRTAGLVELVEVRMRRGGQERRYQAIQGTPLSDQVDGTAMLATALATNLRERASRAPGGERGVTSDAELWLTPQDWSRIRDQFAELVADLHQVGQKPHSPGTVPIGATVMLFPLHDRPVS